MTSTYYKIKGFFARSVIRCLVNLCLFILTMVPKKIHVPRPGRKTILLTGTFYSENWIMNHLRPLLNNENCETIHIVCYPSISPEPKLNVIHPPKVFKLISKTAGRLLYFCWIAFKTRPDLVGGFHILMNGLVVAVMGRLLNIPSIYFCGGGPREVSGGGYFAGNASLALREPDYVLEKKLIKAISHIDHVVAMGQRTVRYFKQAGVESEFHVIPGGIDQRIFRDSIEEKNFDLIFVGRLAPVKRLDLFLKAVQVLAAELPGIKAVIVGNGELESEIKTMIKQLEVEKNIVLAGHQKEVARFLRQSKVFVLTSDSEGLSLAMMEALACGVPCVVSDVGELGEVIEDHVNGFLVQERSGEAFAEKLKACLRDPHTLDLLSSGAKESAANFNLENTSRKWDGVLKWRPNFGAALAEQDLLGRQGRKAVSK